MSISVLGDVSVTNDVNVINVSLTKMYSNKGITGNDALIKRGVILIGDLNLTDVIRFIFIVTILNVSVIKMIRVRHVSVTSAMTSNVNVKSDASG